MKTVAVRCNRCGFRKIYEMDDDFTPTEGEYFGNHTCGDGDVGEFLICL